MVEVVVMLAMFVLIAGLVLASFPTLSQRINFQRSANEFALALRRAQNMAFAVRQADTPSGRRIPPAYGVSVARATPGSYVIFADLAGGSGTADGLYRASDDAVVETVTLGSAIQFGELIADIGGANRREDVITVTFSVPEARMAITNAASPVGESAEIIFTGRTPGFTRSVIVRTTGQIYVR